jgi:hypothetical protein
MQEDLPYTTLFIICNFGRLMKEEIPVWRHFLCVTGQYDLLLVKLSHRRNYLPIKDK